MSNKKYIITAVVLLAISLIAVSKAQPLKMEKSFEVKSGGTFFLKSDAGSVEIESHDSDRVEIKVEKKGRSAEDFEVVFSKDGNDVRVVGKRENAWDWGNYSISVHFIVKVPKDYNVDLKTGGGSIHLSDLKGTVDANTSGGSITLGRIQGDVYVQTSGGAIRVEEVAGNIDAHTSGGSINAKISKQPSDDCRLRTSGGSLTVYLAPQIAVDLEASTSGGRVNSEFDVDGLVKKQKIRGEINGGGPKLELKTSGGSVRIKSL
ncbi:MAG: DUF4097 and DUF4098 domain-containing protein YvlB [Arenicella sp.]|jgi:DUF4097 and DUF4098 domain-containing protein YvlB